MVINGEEGWLRKRRPSAFVAITTERAGRGEDVNFENSKVSRPPCPLDNLETVAGLRIV